MCEPAEVIGDWNVTKAGKMKREDVKREKTGESPSFVITSFVLRIRDCAHNRNPS
jgi:hypothetical protein